MDSAALQRSSDVVLISAVLGEFKRRSSMRVAREILADNANSLLELSKRSVSSLQSRYKLSKSKAAALYAALEISRRYAFGKYKPRKKIHVPKTAYLLMAPELAPLQHYELWIILLDNNDRVIVKKRIAMGGVAWLKVEPKIIIGHAIEYKASKIILVQNDPSGSVQPCKEEIILSKNMVKVANLFDIVIYDYIILAEKEYYSFRLSNKLKD